MHTLLYTLRPLADVRGLSVSPLYDGVVVVHTPCQDKRDKGDWLLETPAVVEFLAAVVRAVKRATSQAPPVTISAEIEHTMKGNKKGKVCFSVGPEPSIKKLKLPDKGGTVCSVEAPAFKNAEGYRANTRRSLRSRAPAKSGGKASDSASEMPALAE